MTAYGEERKGFAQPDDPLLDAAQSATRHFRHGLALQTSGDVTKALSAYTESATLDRRSPDLHNNLGVALQRLGRLPAAEAAYRRSLRLAPGALGSLRNLGSVLREERKLDEAAKVYGQALEQAPDDLLALVNAGHVFRDLGRPDEALSLFEKALEIDRNHGEALRDRAEALLQKGDFKRGFAAYAACRPQASQAAAPRWDGGSLAGKTILVREDTGIEDALLFFRFVPGLSARGARKIIVACRPGLTRLFAMTPGVDSIATSETETPACDYAVSLLDLPHLLDVAPTEVAAPIPYLRAPPPDLPVPQGSRPKIGLSWANPRLNRDVSCPLSSILPLLDNPQWELFGLQEGPEGKDLKELGADNLIRDLSPRMIDHAETAAILAELDLLITVDGPLAHLAGALGLPALVLLPFSAGWRWMPQGQSPWYPSLRLIRQRQPGRWTDVLGELAKELAVWKPDERKHGDRPADSGTTPVARIAQGAPKKHTRKKR